MQNISSQPPSSHRFVMAVVIVHRTCIIVGIFVREAPWIVRGGSAALRYDRAEWCVLVVRGNIAILRHNLAYILVAVVSLILHRITALPHQRASRDYRGRIPDICIAVIVRNLKVTVIDKPLGILRNTTTHAVVGHRNNCLVVCIV